MNILIPHQWLLKHLETQATPQEIQKYVSLSGPSIERIYQIEGESVYDIEVTTNRVDCMNVRGIAREAAVILNQAGIKAKLKPLQLTKVKKEVKKDFPLPKIFNNENLNKRTVFILLTNVKRTPTPKWMGKKLLQTEMNIHDSVIDITNYVTHEIGHPIHAFDYDKLMNTGGEIHIVEAKKGEEFTTLDGNNFETIGGEVVFKNAKGKIIDLPSIKGTANTSIDESTQNVLLLAESIRPEKVRFASMTHAIRTTAAQLMEKDIDPNLAKDTILKAVELYQDLCNAKVGSDLQDHFSQLKSTPTIKVSLEKIHDYLGVTLEKETILKIMTDLECKAEIDEKQVLLVTPPTFRTDLNIPVDIIEEIARIYGYHNLPSKLMATPIPTRYPQGINFSLEGKIKHFLSAIGWQEIYSYSLVSQELALNAGYDLEQHLKLQNPLTDDRVYLRRSLLPSLSEVIKENSQTESLSVFELAHTYQPQKEKLPKQELTLSLVSTQEYRQLRGTLRVLLEQLFVKAIKIAPEEQVSPGFIQSGKIIIKNQEKKEEKIELGTIGVLPNKLVGIEINFSQLLKIAQTHPKYQPIPKTMPIMEDLTFTLSKQALVGEVIRTIRQSNPLVVAVKLKDTYRRNFTFSIHFHDLKKNLAVEEIQPLRKKIVKEVEKNHPAQLVGNV